MKDRVLHLAQSLAGSPLGRRIGQQAYVGVARAVATHLARIPDVAAVYATGSLLSLATLAPGLSDIDLSVVVRAESLPAEIAVRRALAAKHRYLLWLGSTFHGLDPVALDALPLQRAFGTASAIELDRHGLCLAGDPLWTRPAARPGRELAMERFTQALRRWINGSGLLLDPGVRFSEPSALRSAQKILSDVGFAWVGSSRHRSLLDLEIELEVRGMSRLGIANETSVDDLLGAAFEVLSRFACELLPAGPPFAQVASEPGPPSPRLLERLAATLLGGPLVTFTAYRRAPSLDDWVPVVVASPDADGAEAVSALRRRLPMCEGDLSDLRRQYRRPVLLPGPVWGAACLLDPAPFAGAGATRATAWGAPLPPIFAPSAEDLTALLRARAVESLSLQSIIGFRGRPDAARRARDAARRHGRLVPALRSALATGDLDTGAILVPAGVPASDEARVAAMRLWREEAIALLTPLLGDRLAG